MQAKIHIDNQKDIYIDIQEKTQNCASMNRYVDISFTHAWI